MSDISAPSFEHLVRRIAGDADDKETTLVLLQAHIDAAYNRGLEDAADILRRLHHAKPLSRDLLVAANAINSLRDLDQKTSRSAYGFSQPEPGSTQGGEAR